jgi:AcrR family transcriptional regulator
MSSSEARPYHHGDLRRALIHAARQLLENEGPDALSLRAVAREAGVSPAAPYHHFKDKSELLEAVADQGFEELADELRRAKAETPEPTERIAALGAAYAGFALNRRALYRVMSGTARTRGRPLVDASPQSTVRTLMLEAVVEGSAPGPTELDVQLAGIAAWAAIHGLVEMANFKMLEPIKAELGGEQAFLRAVMAHLGVFAGRPRD